MTADDRITAKDILIQSLTMFGADGLICVEPGAECACSVFDFEPCESCNLDMCLPAVIKKNAQGEDMFYLMQCKK